MVENVGVNIPGLKNILFAQFITQCLFHNFIYSLRIYDMVWVCHFDNQLKEQQQKKILFIQTVINHKILDSVAAKKVFIQVYSRRCNVF